MTLPPHSQDQEDVSDELPDDLDGEGASGMDAPARDGAEGEPLLPGAAA